MAPVFDPHRLHEIARSCIEMELPHEEMIDTLVQRLHDAYPGYIDLQPEWFLNLTCGATASMSLLHASLSEYVLIYGTPIGTEAFSGRYPMEIWDVMLAGDMWMFDPASPGKREVSKPGEMTTLPRGTARGFRLPESGWMLEYGRGLLPLSLPRVLAETVTSALDFPTVFKTLGVYGKLVGRQLVKNGGRDRVTARFSAE